MKRNRYLRDLVRRLHADEAGLTPLETVAILAIAAIVIGVCKWAWLRQVRPWFRTSVTNVVNWQGERAR